MTEKVPAEAGDGSQTLERGLAVLVELGRHPNGLTTSQVAAGCGLHRSIAYRLLVSLHRTGFAAKDSEGRYTVGPAASGVAERAPVLLRHVAKDVLHRLAAELDATASLVEVVGGYAVTTVVAEPPTDGPRFSYRLGNRDPLDRGAGGLAALASGPESAGEPTRVTTTREAGYITTHEELNPGAYALACPLPGWGVLAAINIVTNRPDVVTNAVVPLLACADEIDSARTAAARLPSPR